MHSKWRYNIRLGTRKLSLREGSAENNWCIEDFYKLYLDTAARDKIAIHSLPYYERLFEQAATYPDKQKRTRIFFADYEGEPIAAVIVLFRGTKATYLYGASSSAHRNLMAPYALQWKAMCEAKLAGCTEYDMFGIAPDADKNHPMAGLYFFKCGFGGKIIHREGSIDYPCRKFLYAAFRFAESLRSALRKAAHKKRCRQNKKMMV
jgi:lipid II:glycine glycyltransferase (peptidoglycan interpeptide bridge formation enzyme)